MALKPLLEATTRRPTPNPNQSAAFHNLIRDQFTITTWLLLGAILQSLLIFLPIRRLYAIAPAVIILSLKTFDHLLMILGITRNRYMDGIIPTKFAAVFPGEDGSFPVKNSQSGGDQVVVFMLGACANHPLGVFAPGMSKLGDYADKMEAQLNADPERWGFLGATAWTGSAGRTTSNQFMNCMYFRSKEHLHAYAHSPLHREGWQWFNSVTKRYKHIAIMHELYEVPAGSWETIYANYVPTGFAATTHPVTTSKGEKVWMPGVVDAARGRLRTSAGRIGLDDGRGNEKYGEDVWYKEDA